MMCSTHIMKMSHTFELSKLSKTLIIKFSYNFGKIRHFVKTDYYQSVSQVIIGLSRRKLVYIVIL